MKTEIRRPDGVALAFDLTPGRGPAVVFLPGFASDMGGTKATMLQAFCAGRGQAMLRLDYSGHGASQGRMEEGSIGIWADDAAEVIRTALPQARLILVGSSMGGWIALLLALRFKPRIESLLLIAPAADFTETLVRARLSAERKAALERDGVFYEPSAYGAPLPITSKLLEDGRDHLLLGGPIDLTCPVEILHGMEDADVPWQHSLKLAACLSSRAVALNFLKDGDHRLSRPDDLARMRGALRRLLGEDGA